MVDNINNIDIIFSDDAGDLSIESKLINNFEEIKDEKHYNIIRKIMIDFTIINNEDDYEINSLLFHENLISEIVVNYSNLPSICYSKPIYKYDENTYSNYDYELKVLDTKNKVLHVLLEVNCDLSKKVIRYKPSDVVIFDEKDDDKPKMHYTRSLVFECLVYKDNGKLRYRKINPKWLDASAIIDSKRIELTKCDDQYRVINDKDILYLNDYFTEEYGNSSDYLLKIQKRIFNELKEATANRGCNVTCIHAYKYRINKELDMFNILIEYMCCKSEIH